MEAEYGQHFLASYQSVAPASPAAASRVLGQQEVVRGGHCPGHTKEVPLRAGSLFGDIFEATPRSSPAPELLPLADSSSFGSISSDGSTADPGDTTRKLTGPRGASKAPPAADSMTDGASDGDQTDGSTGSAQEAACPPEAFPFLLGRTPLATRDEHPGLQTLQEADLQVQTSLDRFFDDETSWQQVSREVSRSMRRRSFCPAPNNLTPGRKGIFRVQVPKPYPGVQYRMSKDLKDKFPRYLKHGSTIAGEVDEDLEWLRVRGGLLFVPLRIGPVQILEPMPEQGSEAKGHDKSYQGCV